jgi:hypothetical protein
MCWRVEWKNRDSEDSTQSGDPENPRKKRSSWNTVSLESIKRLDNTLELAQRGSPKSSQEQLVRDVQTCQQ